MTHTSGIRHYNPGEMDMKDHFDTIEAAIEIFKDDPLLFEPGTQYSYSSYAWNIVAGIVENVSGQSFDDYMQENVWGPAGMEVTYLEHQGDIVPNRVRQYVKREDAAGVLNAPFADLSIKWAGGGMISTAPDLVRFALAIDAETILSADVHARMTTPYQLADGTMSEYALGWRISTDDLGTWVAHFGRGYRRLHAAAPPSRTRSGSRRVLERPERRRSPRSRPAPRRGSAGARGGALTAQPESRSPTLPGLPGGVAARPSAGAEEAGWRVAPGSARSALISRPERLDTTRIVVRRTVHQ